MTTGEEARPVLSWISRNGLRCPWSIHWHWCQSVLRPGTFFMFRAFTRQGVIPCRSSTSQSGIQQTPVDSMATVVMRQLNSQRAISSRSAVKVRKTRTGLTRGGRQEPVLSG